MSSERLFGAHLHFWGTPFPYRNDTPLLARWWLLQTLYKLSQAFLVHHLLIPISWILKQISRFMAFPINTVDHSYQVDLEIKLSRHQRQNTLVILLFLLWHLPTNWPNPCIYSHPQLWPQLWIIHFHCLHLPFDSQCQVSTLHSHTLPIGVQWEWKKCRES